MNLNPITALSDQVQKLIVEHGSSSILRDHLSMLKDQVVLLEKQLGSLSESDKNHQLKIEKLESENEKLRQEVESYKQPADYKMKWGCVSFHSDEALYCPKCFFDKSRKIPTTRSSSKFRVCSVCQSQIPTR